MNKQLYPLSPNSSEVIPHLQLPSQPALRPRCQPFSLERRDRLLTGRLVAKHLSESQVPVRQVDHWLLSCTGEERVLSLLKPDQDDREGDKRTRVAKAASLTPKSSSIS